MKTLKMDFLDILENKRIKSVFQPIVNLKTGEIAGYEGLSRITQPCGIQSAEELFQVAGLFGKVWELELVCREKLLEQFHKQHKTDNTKLFLNVSPLVIHDKEFCSGFTREYLKKYDLDINNIVFEVTERSAIDDANGFKDIVRHYKSQGYNIAVDDAGSCYSGLNLIVDIVPEYLKLDITLIHNIHKDVIKYAMVKSLVEFADLVNIQLVAEGIECEEELKALLKLGVHNGQGFFLRRPDEDLRGVEEEALEIINKFNKKKNNKIKKCKSENREFRVILFKFESYKAYSVFCDKYGDKYGDGIVELMNSVVEQNLSDEENAVALGADGIIAVMEKNNFKMKCEVIENIFRNRIQNYYHREDWDKGGIEIKKKNGEMKKYPIINICSERLV